MNILHEVNQLDCGGVEKVVRNIIAFDKVNKHHIITYADGNYRVELEKAGATIYLFPREKEIEIDLVPDILHIHTGGADSDLARSLGSTFPTIETIHSPVRSRVPDSNVRQRVGVTEAVTRKNKNCITIVNGIDFDTLVETRPMPDIFDELKIPNTRPVIGRLGRLGPDKGLEDFLMVCHFLQKEGLEFTPLIVGDEARQSDGYRGKLKLTAASLPVRGVVWAGAHFDIANYLQVMDVFFYPSRTEGFGLVFAEAMYCGAVVVTIDNDVNREVCGGHAMLVEDNIGAMTQGIRTALEPAYRDAVIPLAHEYVEAEFDAERMSKDYQDLYERIKSNV
jgi:glycosyltransferase involved in cell wall biosynthesis